MKRKRVHHLVNSWNEKPIQRALEYACGSISEIIPSWSRRMFWAEHSALYIDVDEARRRATDPDTIGPYERSPSGTVADVSLPPEILLRRSVSVPVSSRSQQFKIVELDLVRRTPFQLRDVYWTLGAEGASERGTVFQWVARKSDIEDYRSRLRAQGMNVRRFLVESGGRKAVLADYSHEFYASQRHWRRLNAGLAGICALAGLVIWLSPAWHARAELGVLVREVEQLRDEAVLQRATLADTEARHVENEMYLDAILQRTRAIDALRLATVVMPDEVWISEFTMRDGRLRVVGETSGSTSDLVLKLTQMQGGLTPTIDGTISRTAEGRERFSMLLYPRERN